MTAGVGVLALYTFTRVLSPTEYGRYSVVLAVAGLISAMGFQWLRQCLVRFGMGEADRREDFLGTLGLLFAGLIALLMLIFVAIVALQFETDELSTYLILTMLILAASQAWFEFALDARRVDLKPILYSLAAFLRAVFVLALGASAALFTDDLPFVIFAVSLGYLMASLVAIPRWFGALGSFHRANLQRAKEFVRYGFPLALTLGFISILNSADLIMLSAMRGSFEAGIYASAYNLAQYAIGTLLAGLGLAILPLATKCYSDLKPEQSRELLGKNLTLIAAVGFPITVGLSVVSPELGELLLGNFVPLDSTLITVIVSAGVLLSGFRSYAFDVVFMLNKKTKLQAGILGFSAFFNLALNMVLIPSFGGVGAAVATLLSFFLALILSIVLSRRHMKIPIEFTVIFKIILSAAVMGLLVTGFGEYQTTFVHLVFDVAIGVGSYIAMIFFLNPAGVRSKVVRRIKLGRESL